LLRLCSEKYIGPVPSNFDLEFSVLWRAELQVAIEVLSDLGFNPGSESPDPSTRFAGTEVPTS
jgi:hypothetical protein